MAQAQTIPRQDVKVSSWPGGRSQDTGVGIQ